MTPTTRRTILISLLMAPGLAAGEKPGRPTSPRIIFNCDGDSTTLSHFKPPITPEQLCRTLDELKGTQVDVFVQCMNRGDDTFSHRTKVGEIYGRNVTEWNEGAIRKGMKRIAENTWALLDAGHDPFEILAKRARELGMQFWVSMRMNDIHEDDSTRFYPLRSTFKMKHPELLIGSPYPDPARGYPADNFTWAFDFARREVHNHKLALIAEVCTNYDVDGFELDFQRGPWYFKKGQELRGMPMMTEFVRRVRREVNEIGKRKGRALTLAVRVPVTFDACADKGLDVRTWIREGLADVITPMDAGYLDMHADVRGFVDLAKGTRCAIAGGLEHSTLGYGHADIAILRAGAMGFWDQGASSIYLFNYDCHRRKGRHAAYTPQEIEALRQIGSPEIIARRDKRYVVAVDMSHRTPEDGGTRQLPVVLSRPGEQRAFAFWIGDDLAAARRDGVLAKIVVAITTRGAKPSQQALRVCLNGHLLGGKGHTYQEGAIVYVDPSSIRRGRNDLTIEHPEGADKTAKGIRIERIAIDVSYRNAK